MYKVHIWHTLNCVYVIEYVDNYNGSSSRSNEMVFFNIIYIYTSNIILRWLLANPIFASFHITWNIKTIKLDIENETFLIECDMNINIINVVSSDLQQGTCNYVMICLVHTDQSMYTMNMQTQDKTIHWNPKSEIRLWFLISIHGLALWCINYGLGVLPGYIST